MRHSRLIWANLVIDFQSTVELYACLEGNFRADYESALLFILEKNIVMNAVDGAFVKSPFFYAFSEIIDLKVTVF